MTGKSRLTQSDWTDAALAAMASQGTTGVNVEQLARALGTTKGSFYHHFDNRRALLEAALARWEEIVESDLLDAVGVADPRQRLLESSLAGLDSALDGFVDLALASSADDPTVAPVLQRITERRLQWLTKTLAELGIEPTIARARAEAGLATYLGLFHLQRVSGRRFDDEYLRAQITDAVDVMCEP